MSPTQDDEFVNGEKQSEESCPDVIVDVVSNQGGRPASEELLLVIITLPPVLNWTRTIRRVIHWLRCGSPLVWVVDPASRMVTVLRPNQLPQVLEENDELTGAPAFPDLRCRVADLFFVTNQ
jgi:Uma2 family endonuclease